MRRKLQEVLDAHPSEGQMIVRSLNEAKDVTKNKAEKKSKKEKKKDKME